jgi:probable HAF family extracellular repeat protein
VAGGQRPGSSEGDPEATLYKVDGQRSRLGPGLSIANGMNDRGQIVGGNWVWRASTVTHLTGLPSLPDLGVMARAINVSGVVVGSAATGTGPVQPALWRNGKITDLGSLPGITHSTARAINAAGDVVGTADDECFPCAAPRAWRWRAGVLTPLDDLIPAGSGWTLREANGVNDRGQIVGTGLHNGTTRAYLLTPRVHINISFGPASAPLPVGYNRDSGAVYGPRPGGLTYGWNSDNSALTRDRDAASSPDQRYDTLTHLQKAGAGTRWELAVPSGTYLVHVVAGDPAATDSRFRISAEGTLAVDATPTAASPWAEGTVCG